MSMTPLIYFAFLFGFGSAYDSFEGSFPQLSACFPTHDDPSCTLERIDCPNSLPKAPGGNKPNTMMYLFTAKSPDKAEALHKCPNGLPPNSTFNPKHRTIVLFPGYFDGPCRTAWMREMKLQFFIRGPYNIILVDWTWGNGVDVPQAGLNARIAGFQVACVLIRICKTIDYDSSKYHMIGHSFGTAAVGEAGRAMREECKAGRITVLEPASPPYAYTTQPLVVTPDDAYFVDAVHSNSGLCFGFTFSDPRPSGHVDFYMNDGTHQLSCAPYLFASFLKLDIVYALLSLWPPYCSHWQAIQYFKVSINAVTADYNEELVGVECDNYEDFKSGKCARQCEGGYPHCMVMGMDAELYYNKNDTKTRSYFVPTALECPYNDYSGFTGLPLTPLNKEE